MKRKLCRLHIIAYSHGLKDISSPRNIFETLMNIHQKPLEYIFSVCFFFSKKHNKNRKLFGYSFSRFFFIRKAPTSELFHSERITDEKFLVVCYTSFCGDKIAAMLYVYTGIYTCTGMDGEYV